MGQESLDVTLPKGKQTMMRPSVETVSDYYTMHEIRTLLQKAQDLGHPLDKGSYLEKMTIKQLDALVNKGTLDA